MTPKLDDGWTGRRTGQTRVAFHENGGTVIFQNGSLVAEAKGITPRVLAFLFGDLIAGERSDAETTPSEASEKP